MDDGTTGGDSVALSVLDLSPIAVGSDAGQALRNTVDLARHAEAWGYRRFWVAEHHNIAGVAGAATAVVVGLVAGGTTTIRVGAGGIMLPNHAPLVIAEQFGTLASLYPDRIDLGLGRAPGSDTPTARALRRTLRPDRPGVDSFPDDVLELQSYLAPATPGQVVRAVPGQGTNVPLWILGSSDYGANLAAELGLPYAFASHFAPDSLMPALAAYRSRFRPSAALAKPYVIVGVNAFAAETDAEARRLFTSLQQAFLGIFRNDRRELPPPVDSMDGLWSAAERQQVDRMTRVSVVGSPATIRRGLAAIAEATGADELILTAQIFDHAARLRSFEIVSQSRPQSWPDPVADPEPSLARA